MHPATVEWLDAMGSCTALFDEETGGLSVRGVPCRDFHHRGFDVLRRGSQFAVKDTQGSDLGNADGLDEAIALGVAGVAGLDITTAAPPPLRPISPGAARVCRDWSFHVACFDPPAPLPEDRAEALQAVTDAVTSQQLAAIEGRSGTGSHHIVANLAVALLERPPSPELAGTRVLELDWLKLNAGQTASNALGPGEGLARALETMLAARHVPVIPRGRVAELTQVMPPDLPGIVLCSRPTECLAISLFGPVVRVRLTEPDDSLLRRVVTDEARKLESELGVTITDQAIDYVLTSGARCAEQDVGPLVFIELPGALSALLRMGCRRVASDHSPDAPRKPVVTPTDLAIGLINLGVPTDSALRRVFQDIFDPGPEERHPEGDFSA